jgi:predicted aspartyl protease
MSFPFQPQRGLIHVEAELEGPAGNVNVLLALDTGATGTTVSDRLLRIAGYDPAAAPAQVRLTTASGTASIPQLAVTRLTTLGRDRMGFAVLALTLPSGTAVDGVLGLDFLRGCVLTIDFRAGQITLA